MRVEKEQALKLREQARKLARLRQRVRINEADMIARAELAREEDRIREERKNREERVKKVKKLVWQYLEAMDPYIWPVFEDIEEKAPDEYFATGRAYCTRLFPQWADFEIMVNMQTGEMRV